MTNFKAILGAFVGLSLVPAAAMAGSAGQDLPPEVAQMHCLVGHWSGTMAAEMGGKKLRLRASITCEPASGGHAIACRSKFEGTPMGTIEETDLFGYDANTKTYHWYAVSSAGEVHDHVAKIPKGPTISFVYRSKAGGKPFVEAIDMTFSKSKQRIQFSNRTSVGGKTVFSMKGTVRKR